MRGDTVAEPQIARMLDAFPLDAYLVEMLLQQLPPPQFLNNWLRPISSSQHPAPAHWWWTTKETPTTAAARAALCIATLLATRGKTPALQCLGLELRDRSAPQPPTVFAAAASQRRRRPSWSRLILYSVLQFVLPVVHGMMKNLRDTKRELLRNTASRQRRRRRTGEQDLDNKHTGGDSDDDAAYQRRSILALGRQCMVLDALIVSVGRVAPVLNLATLLLCWSGLQRTPSLAMLCSGLEYSSTSPSPSATTSSSSSSSVRDHRTLLHVNYAHRRWLFEEGLQLVQLYTTGLSLAGSVWGPSIHDLWNRIGAAAAAWRCNRRGSAPLLLLHRLLRLRRGGATASSSADSGARRCPLCQNVPAAITVQAHPCHHVYCYTCLYSAAHRHARQFRCRTCGIPIARATFTVSNE
jgi:hypothetical protein